MPVAEHRLIVPTQPAGYPRPVAPPTAGARRGRGAVVFAGIAAALAAVVAIAALVVVLADGDDPTPPPEAPAPVPTLAGRPPTDVVLRDGGQTVTVSWRDPTAGDVSFIVAGGRSGQQLRAMGELGPGRTEYRLSGLNPRLEYCFTVVAVYGGGKVAASDPVCTARGGSARPGATG